MNTDEVTCRCIDCQGRMERYDEKFFRQTRKIYWRCERCSVRAIAKFVRDQDGVLHYQNTSYHRYADGKVPEFILSMSAFP